MSQAFDVIVIGSGPGGYVGAIRAAQLGLNTAIIEKDSTFGGTCLNVGCIPSKALLESSEHFAQAQHDFEDHGISVGKVNIDVAKMLARKDKIVKDSTNGIAFLFKKNKITAFTGMGKVKSSQEVEVTGADGKKQILTANAIILATGSVPNELPHLKFDGETVVSSTEALSFKETPESLVVVGGGVIGLELGSVWQRLGAKVSVIEFAPRLCPTMDQQVSKKLQQILTKQGMEFVMESKVTGIKKTKNGAEVEYESLKDGAKKTIQAEKVLVATGRRPFSDGLGLEEVGVIKDQRGFVQVDEHYQTSVPGIFAIGDLIPGPMLAHKAEEEGVAVAEMLAGLSGHVNYHTVPSVIYTEPEVAAVGYTEEQLKEQGVPYKAGQFPFTPNGRARAMGQTDGFVKILAHAETDEVLGVHMIGPKVSELIAETVMAMEFNASSEDIARSFHAHPTLAEVIREAALAVDGRARQM